MNYKPEYDAVHLENKALKAEIAELKERWRQFEEYDCDELRVVYALLDRKEATIASHEATIKVLRECLENHSGNYKLTKAEGMVIGEALALPAPNEHLREFGMQCFKRGQVANGAVDSVAEAIVDEIIGGGE